MPKKDLKEVRFSNEDAADAFYRFAGPEHENITEDIKRYKESLEQK